MRRSLVVIMTGLVISCAAASSGRSQVDGELHIVALGDTILSLDDIAAADCSTGELTLSDRGAARWQRWAHSERRGDHVIPKLSRLCDAECEVELKGRVIATGHFTSSSSSRHRDGLLISDALIVPGTRTLRLNWGCCVERSKAELLGGRDRFMAQLWGFLRRAGKSSGECGAS